MSRKAQLSPTGNFPPPTCLLVVLASGHGIRALGPDSRPAHLPAPGLFRSGPGGMGPRTFCTTRPICCASPRNCRTCNGMIFRSVCTTANSHSQPHETCSAPCGQHHHAERSHEVFNRTLQLPVPLDTDHVVADLQNGVLTVICSNAVPTGVTYIHFPSL